MMIAIGPQNWKEQAELLLILLEAANSNGKAKARAEIRRMAELADKYVEIMEKKLD